MAGVSPEFDARRGRGVLIVGPVTWDLIDGHRVPGGTVSYAARTAAAMGVRARVLTTAAGDADLSALAGHEVHVVPAEHTMLFEHRFDAGGRHLRVPLRTGRSLGVDDLPPGWGTAGVVMLAPLVDGDLELDGLVGLPADECCVTGQGLLRSLDDAHDVVVAHAPTDSLQRAITPRTSLFLSEDEVSGWPPGAVEELACRARRIVITRGARGAEIVDSSGRRAVAPVPAQPVDTTGAGDVFAAAFILAVGEGEAAAARLAAAYAAAAVEVEGPAPLPDRASIEQRLRSGQGDPWRS